MKRDMDGGRMSALCTPSRPSSAKRVIAYFCCAENVSDEAYRP